MVLVEPEQGVGEQEVADLVAAVVEDHRAPVGMLALPRVFVLVAGRAVEAAQAVAVAREVGRHPVENHADAVLVAVIDEVGEIFRRAVAAGDGEVADGLIAPRAGKRMLADRHQFDVRVAHFLAIGDELMRQLAIVQPAVMAVRAALPAAEMHFIDRDRFFELVAYWPAGPSTLGRSSAKRD